MNRKYKLHPGDYELGENEKFYGDMEARGWRLVKRGGYFSRFQRVEPSEARYRVEVYTPPFLEQSVLPEEKIAETCISSGPRRAAAPRSSTTIPPSRPRP